MTVLTQKTWVNAKACGAENFKRYKDLKDYIKGQNSIEYKPPVMDVFTGEVHKYRTPTLQEKAYLKSNVYDQFKPQLVTDIFSGSDSKGNNVELEREMKK